MWYLEGFDSETERLVEEFELPKINEEDIRRILTVAADQPVYPFEFRISTMKQLFEIIKYCDINIEVKKSLEYYIGYSRD